MLKEKEEIHEIILNLKKKKIQNSKTKIKKKTKEINSIRMCNKKRSYIWYENSPWWWYQMHKCLHEKGISQSESRSLIIRYL